MAFFAGASVHPVCFRTALMASRLFANRWCPVMVMLMLGMATQT